MRERINAMIVKERKELWNCDAIWNRLLNEDIMDLDEVKFLVDKEMCPFEHFSVICL